MADNLIKERTSEWLYYLGVGPNSSNSAILSHELMTDFLRHFHVIQVRQSAARRNGKAGYLCEILLA